MAALRDLELRHLIALDAVVTEGTFGRAATRLGYTQSAVSQQIAALERLIGGSLFDRPGGPRPVALTPFGKLVLEHARAVIARVDSAGEAVERYLAGEVGRIDVGTFQSVSNVLLPEIVRRLRVEYPLLDIRLFEDEHKEEGATKVAHGELDVTFTVGPRSGDLESIVLLDDPFVLVAPAGELANGPFPTAELDGRPLVGYPVGMCQEEIDEGLRDVGATPTFVFRTADNGAQIAMVRAGMGWALMPLLCVDVTDRTIDVRELRPAIPPRQVCLVWRRDRTMSPVARRLVELARDVAGHLRQLPLSA
ncbi:MAG: LysR family transcriptional regulator [Acidimicrobiia bacterium]|nr:LysR family transcriptional regulator [Acidimicrobiia bacterium]